jgi:hypothetical protein
MTSRTFAMALGNAAKQSVEDDYSVTRMVQQYESLYRQLLAAR